MRIKITTESPDTLTREGLALGFFIDERPPRGKCGLIDWRLNGLISRELARGRITGTFMEKVLIATSPRVPAAKIMLMGMGTLAELTYEKLYLAGYHLSKDMDGLLCREFAFNLPAAGRCHLSISGMAEAMIRGCFDFLSSDIEKWATCSTTVLTDAAYLKEVIDGVNSFRCNVRDVSVIEIEGVTEEGA